MLRQGWLTLHWRLSLPCRCSYRDVAFEEHREWSVVALAAGVQLCCMTGWGSLSETTLRCYWVRQLPPEL